MSNAEPRPPLRHPGGRFAGPIEKPKRQRETLARIWSYMRQQRIGMYLAVAFVIVGSLLSLVGPYMIGHITDNYILKFDVDGAIKMALILAGVYTVHAILTWLQSYVMIYVSQKTIRTLRQELFEKIQSLPLAFFDKRQQGDLMSRMTNDIDNLNAALSQSVVQIMSSLLTIVGTAIVLFYLNIVLAVVTLVVVPLIV